MNNSIPIYNGPIAVLDMLGFKDYVQLNSIQSVIDEYAHVITSASFTADVMQENLEFMVYSDTIAIRLIDNSEKGFYNFIRAIHLISHQYFYKCQIPGMNPIPIRGAIAFGEYSWHKGDISTQVLNRKPIVAKNINFIVGQAILDAHDLESKQSWIAISLTYEIGELLKKHFPQAFFELEKSKYIIEYDIPLHNDCTTKGYVINPTERAIFNESFLAFCETCNQILEKTSKKAIAEKYINSLKLLKIIYDENDLCPRWDEKLLKEIPRKKIDFNSYEEIIAKFSSKYENK